MGRMDQRKSLIITALVLIFIIAVIVGTIVFLVRGVRTRTAGTTSSPSPEVVVPTFSPAPEENQQPRGGDTIQSATHAPAPAGNNKGGNIPTNNLKTYNGASFSVQYPGNWGILTCSNSQNVEFDPTSPTDQLNVRCDVALKPVTILVGTNPTCDGETVKLGNVTVQRSIQQTSVGKNYRWCSQTIPSLDITHRASSTPSRATSLQDYASQIEEMIKTFKPGAGS